MTLHTHAWRRVTERLSPSEQQDFFARMKQIEEYAPHLGHDYAIRVLQTGRMHGKPGWFSPVSNGEDLWCIIRRGEIKTVMFRRSNQQPDAWALRVDKVVLL